MRRDVLHMDLCPPRVRRCADADKRPA
jgi:hypothetical protein